jgi:hypothetical protein
LPHSYTQQNGIRPQSFFSFNTKKNHQVSLTRLCGYSGFPFHTPPPSPL